MFAAFFVGYMSWKDGRKERRKEGKMDAWMDSRDPNSQSCATYLIFEFHLL